MVIRKLVYFNAVVIDHYIPDSKLHTFPDNPVPRVTINGSRNGKRRERQPWEELGEPGGMTFAVLQHARYRRRASPLIIPEARKHRTRPVVPTPLAWERNRKPSP